MEIGKKINRLRKERNLSQAQLAIKIGTDARRISNYENGVNVPTTDALIKIADFFNVSVDYLVKTEVDNMASTPIKDKNLLRQFEEVDKLPENEKEHIKYLIQSVLDKNRFKNLAKEAV
ncbi:MAG: helix-turn-helix transcriptional regulator [Deltaproteobacteria bacterium]|nr:helix-turn-helix transcriptional regulator [Deltaproteobacteria bacterium]